MAGLLGDIFSTVDTAKRKLTDLLGNPVLSAQQIIGNMNDRARVLNQLTAGAAQERELYGPKSQQLANMIADAYNPIGMIVYHGSPAKFSRFDPTKIGSGEGAQAYGYGHYVAQNPAVAKEYRTVLSEPELFVKGRQIKTAAGSNMDTAKAWLQDSFEMGAKNPYADAIKKVSNAPLKDKQGVIDALRKLENRGVQMQKGGFEYEIDLPDEQIAKMLDWDKPLSQQAPEVQRAAAMFGPKAGELTGQELYKKAAGFDPMVNVASKIGGDESVLRRFFPKATDAQIAQAIAASKRAGANDAIAAQMLRDAGIPGIRYLDGGSRGAGQGTSNFVVFPGNENILQILERNGQPLGLMGVR